MFNVENKNSLDNKSFWLAIISLGKRMHDNYHQISEGLLCRKGIRTKTEITEVQNFNLLHMRGSCLTESLQALKQLKELDFLRAIRREGFCMRRSMNEPLSASFNNEALWAPKDLVQSQIKNCKSPKNRNNCDVPFHLYLIIWN